MNHKIKITLTNDGDFRYIPSSSHRMKKSDTIEWECTNDAPYCLHFGWGSPFQKGRYRANAGEIIAPELRENVSNGSYKYSVAVWFNGEIWTDDPELLIEPEP